MVKRILPKNQISYRHDGKFSYSVVSWKKNEGIKDINKTINHCLAGAWIIAKKKCRVYPISKVSDSLLPYNELNFPTVE